MARPSAVAALPARSIEPAAGCRAALPARMTQPLEFRFDAPSGSVWITMLAPTGLPVYLSPGLLDAFEQALGDCERDGFVGKQEDEQIRPIHYAVLRSNHPLHFDLGGDLGRFHALIGAGDFDTLRAYAMRCLDVTWRWLGSIARHATTVWLVQGREFGAGFETALSSDDVIAEEHAEFGLPEILFGLSPCGGAMTLVARRIGLSAVDRMVRGGRIYRAVELLEMGVTDQVCPTGEGEHFTHEWIAAHAKARPARRALERARHRMMPPDRAEMTAGVEDRIDAARQLTPENLRILDTLARMQGNDGPQ